MSLQLCGKSFNAFMTEKLKEYIKEKEIYPEFNIITSGDNAASKIYVNNKVKKAEEIGIKANVIHFDYIMSKNEIEDYIYDLPTIVQLPITGNITEKDVNALFDYALLNDVDGFAYDNSAKLAMGETPNYYPCTPKGVIDLLAFYGFTDFTGKNVVVVGRSNIVGKPMARLFLERNANVTILHSKTKPQDLQNYIRNADIVVSAVGKKDIIDYRGKYVDGEFIQGFDPLDKIFIDVGVSRDENGKICGDIEQNTKELSRAYTPSVGGVGPCTVIELMKNVVKAFTYEPIEKFENYFKMGIDN